ncbi:MAG: methyl-accepting chemotaxis protein [Treponema sp.]|nr:methyl-accepting chemotaxis protein [Candidatus Treponema equi]
MNSSFDRQKTFEIELMDTGRWKNLSCGALFFAYTLFSSGILLNMTRKDFLSFLFSVLIVSLVAQFVVAPLTNRMLVKNISDRLEKNDNGGLSVDERTMLLRDLLRCPKSIAAEVSLVVLGAAVIPVIILLVRSTITLRTLFYVIICCCGGLFASGIQAFSYSETLCCKKAQELIKQGINPSIIHKDKFYGLTTKMRVLYFNILPLFIAAMVISSLMNMALFDGWSGQRILSHILFALITNTFMLIYLALHMHRILLFNTSNIIEVLETLTDDKKGVFLPTDLNHELSYNIYLIDELISYLRNISFEASTTGEDIAISSQKLSEDANITAETSISEAAAIRECLATMENAKNQHRRISSHIDFIQQSAARTKESADISSELLSAGIQKMSEITQSNLDTIYGIKDLSERIDAINEIVDSIDAMAERTKTIAFNAELEASIAGDQGEKFHIVSNEILRLAASIKNSISEINQKIKDILHSCDNLIISSESGTQKTREGSEFYYKLENSFKNLCLSSDITAESLKKIVDITDVQQGAFEQINAILVEINSGFDNFSQMSQKISSETKTLRETAANLGFSIKKSSTGGAK